MFLSNFFETKKTLAEKSHVHVILGSFMQLARPRRLRLSSQVAGIFFHSFYYSTNKQILQFFYSLRSSDQV